MVKMWLNDRSTWLIVGSGCGMMAVSVETLGGWYWRYRKFVMAEVVSSRFNCCREIGNGPEVGSSPVKHIRWPS